MILNYDAVSEINNNFLRRVSIIIVTIVLTMIVTIVCILEPIKDLAYFFMSYIREYFSIVANKYKRNIVDQIKINW